MLINWETLPVILCLWMGVLLAIQYRSNLLNKTILLCIVYFLVLFASGLTILSAQAVALRLLASSILLALVGMGIRSKQAAKDKALVKLPLVFALLGWTFQENLRVLSMLEGFVGLAMGIALWVFRKEQGVRLRYFIKSAILGIIYLLVRKLSPAWPVQLIATCFKLAALYYIYCWVSSYATQEFLGKLKNE